MKPQALSLWARMREGVEPLWVCGLVLLQIGLVSRLVPLHGSRLNLAQYFLLGTLLPVAVLAITTARALPGPASHLVRSALLALAAYAAWIGLWFVQRQRGFLIPVLTVILAALFATLLAVRVLRSSGTVVLTVRYRPDGHTGELARFLPVALVSLLAMAVSWSAAWRLGFWLASREGYLDSSFNLIVFALSTVLVTVNLALRPHSGDVTNPRLFSFANVAALALLGLMSLRVDTLGAPHSASTLHNHFMGDFAFHHWGAIVGSAEMVRQGGWLLWDVPAQYGFLSTLCLAWLPVSSVWQSLYLLHATLLFLSAVFLFLVLRAAGSGARNFLFSLAVTLAATFLVPGGSVNSTGPFIHPPLGAYRYFWCYALVGILAWDFVFRRARPPHRGLLIGGCVAWLIGCLWSAESCAYSSVIWLSGYTLLVWRRTRMILPGDFQRIARVRMSLAWVLLPVAMLLGAGAILWGFYVVRLGHGPDWRSFYDYLISFSGLLQPSLPLNPDGPVLTFLLVFSALATLCAYLFSRRKLGALGLALGSTAALWVASSYFVARGADSYALCAITHVAASIAVALLIMSKLPLGRSVTIPIKAAFVPILSLILTLGFGNRDHLPDWIQPLRRGYVRRIENLLPVVPPSLQSLLDEAGVRLYDPIVYIQKDSPGKGFFDGLGIVPVRRGRDERGLNPPWTCQAWLPTTPLELFVPLPESRSRAYMARFVARTASGGWLLEPKPASAHVSPWFFDELARTHTPVRSFENLEWRITWYQPRERLGRVARRQPAPDRAQVGNRITPVRR